MNPETATKLVEFIGRLDRIQQTRRAAEREISALYDEANQEFHLDVPALKATVACRHDCLDGEQLFGLYKTFSRHLRPRERAARRAEREQSAVSDSGLAATLSRSAA